MLLHRLIAGDAPQHDAEDHPRQGGDNSQENPGGPQIDGTSHNHGTEDDKG